MSVANGANVRGKHSKRYILTSAAYSLLRSHSVLYTAQWIQILAAVPLFFFFTRVRCLDIISGPVVLFRAPPPTNQMVSFYFNNTIYNPERKSANTALHTGMTRKSASDKKLITTLMFQIAKT